LTNKIDLLSELQILYLAVYQSCKVYKYDGGFLIMLEDYESEAAPYSWQLKIATEADVDPAVEALSEQMNDQQRAAFRDKLQRYVRKPDRELIVAVRGGQTLGLVCVIHQVQFPPRFPEQQASHLRNFASGTQLIVHPSCRRQGIGGSLLAHAEAWAHERGLTGFWIVTHRMVDWYERNFGYQQIARIEVKKVAKTVMAKKFA
jgi:GNAT superfamily N-acetyltransferase